VLKSSQVWSAGGALLAAAALAPVAVASADTTLASGLPASVKVSMRGTAVAWSEPAPAGGFKLVIRNNGVARDAAVAPSPRPFDVDLGDDGRGHLIATYSRCSGRLEGTTPRGCDVYMYAVTAARERRVAGLGRGAASDYLPTAARGRIAFARSVRGGHPRLYVRALDGGRLRGLPFGRRQVGSGPTSLDLGARGLAIAWKRTADYGSQQVRYDRLRGGSKVLATYGGGALAGTDVVGVSATRTGVFWGTEGYGEGIGWSRLYLVARLNASSESRDPGMQLTSASGANLRDAIVLSCELRDFGATNCSVVLLGPQ
jgi:hypothetical protein